MYRAGHGGSRVLKRAPGAGAAGAETMDLEEERLRRSSRKGQGGGVQRVSRVLLLCTSVNSEIVTGYGRPSGNSAKATSCPLRFRMEVDGYYGDSA